MRKTLILAAATLAIGLAGQAQAGWNNGMSLNGYESGNGLSINGLGINGLGINGMDTENGMSINGLDSRNGMGLNGLESENGVQRTGAVSGTPADVTLQGVTLPGGEVIQVVMHD